MTSQWHLTGLRQQLRRVPTETHETRGRRSENPDGGCRVCASHRDSGILSDRIVQLISLRPFLVSSSHSHPLCSVPKGRPGLISRLLLLARGRIGSAGSMGSGQPIALKAFARWPSPKERLKAGILGKRQGVRRAEANGGPLEISKLRTG